MFLTRRRGAVGLLVALLLVCFAGAVGAQQQLAAVQGTISDPSKAVVPNVTVTVKNLDTGNTRTTTTNADGIYRVQGLEPGRYEVAAELTGFKKAVRSGLVLSVGATVGLNLRLETGVVTETIEVSGGAPDIQTETASVSAVVERQKLVDLPNLARNVFAAAQLQPGINTMDPGGNIASFNSYEYGAGLQASGTRDSGTTVMMDGASISSSPWAGTVVLIPNQDSVQEFEVIANNPSAEYGRNAGAAVSIVTKGGTNDLHGSVYEFYRNEKLNARNAFEDPSSVKTPYKHNDFGGSLGGPIKKDRTFFFVSYEGLRESTQYGASNVVETKQFVDYVLRTRPSSNAAQLLQKYPPLAYPTTDLMDLGSPAPGAGQWSTAPDGIMDVGTINVVNKDTSNGNQFNGRLDHIFNSGNDRLRVTFYRTSVSGSGTPIRAAFNNPMPTNMISLNVAESHSLGRATLNEFSFGYLRGHGEAGDVTPGVPTITFDDVPGFGVTFWHPITYTQNIFEFRDVVTINRGRHSIRAGAEYKYVKDYSVLHHWERPNYYFQSLLDFADDEPWQEERAVDPATGLATTAPGDYRTKEGALFIQDNWKVRPNLTLNLGLRWEVFGAPGKAGNGFNGIILGPGATRQEQMRTARMAAVDKIYDTDWNNVGPRLGFAWDPRGNSKLVLRGGFGVAYNRLGDTVWSDERLNPPQFAHAVTTLDTPSIPIVYSLGPSYAQNPALGAGVDANGGIRGARVSLRIIDPEATTPYTYNWFLGVQRDLGRRFVLDVNYLATSSRNWMNGDGPGSQSYNRYAGDLADGVFNGENPSFSTMGIAESIINSRYNGLTVQLQRRLHDGFSFQAAYTYGKVTDTANTWQEVTRPDLEKGPADYDVRHRLALNFILQIPSPSQNGVVRQVFGGWQLNCASIYQSGLPFSVYGSRLDSNLDGTYRDRPNTPSWGDSKSGLSSDDYLNGIFKASDFPLPAAGQLGTLGRNTFRGPRYFSTDLSLFKNIQFPWFVSKEATLQLRAEAFNVFNTRNLNNPSGNLASSAFGKSTWAKTPRVVQLGVKLIF